MEWYNQILKENPVLAEYNDIATTHINSWTQYANSGFSDTPETPYIISFAVTVLVGLFLLWAVWRLISAPFRKKSPRTTKSSLPQDFALIKPDNYEQWPYTMQDSFIQAELFLAQQSQKGVPEAATALEALKNKDHAPALDFFGSLRDNAQMKGDQDEQLKMVRHASAFHFSNNIAAAQQTIAHGLSLNPQDPLSLLLNGDIALRQNKVKEAFASYNQALVSAKEQQHTKGEMLALSTLGDIALRQKNIPQAEAHFADSLALSNKMIKSQKKNKSWQKMAISSHLKLGKSQLLQQKFDLSNESYRQGLALQEQMVAQSPNNIPFQRESMLTQIQIGESFTIQKELEQAHTSFLNAVQKSKALYEKQPNIMMLKRDYALALNKLGQNDLQRGEKESSLENYTTSLTLKEEILAQAQGSTTLMRDVAIGHERLGDYHRTGKNFPTSGQHYNQAFLLSKKAAEKVPNSLLYLEDMIRYLSRISFVQNSTGKKNEAISTLSKAIQMKEKIAEKQPNNIQFKTDLAGKYLTMSKLDTQNARALLNKALNLLQPISEKLSKPSKALIASIEQQLQALENPLATSA